MCVAAPHSGLAKGYNSKSGPVDRSKYLFGHFCDKAEKTEILQNLKKINMTADFFYILDSF